MAYMASVVESVSPSASVDNLTGVYPSGHVRQRLVSSIERPDVHHIQEHTQEVIMPSRATGRAGLLAASWKARARSR